VTTTNYIPRATENDRRIKTDTNVNSELLPQQQDHRWSAASTRIHSTDDQSLVGTTNNVRISSIPSSSVHNMIIGLLFHPTFILIENILLGKDRSAITTSYRPSTIAHTRRDTSLPKSSRNISSAKTQRLTLNTIHRCTSCNKSFDDKRNYDMHKLHCRT
jgi:uncharacterized protein with PIN domain